MKKLVAMSMIACMAMATVACGSSNSGDTAAAETTESTETADAAEDAEAADTADTSDKTCMCSVVFLSGCSTDSLMDKMMGTETTVSSSASVDISKEIGRAHV